MPLSLEKPQLVNKVNVRGTLNLLEVSTRADVERFVYTSSCAVYGEARYLPIKEGHSANPLSPYAVPKLAGEYCYQVFVIATGSTRFALGTLTSMDPNR